MDYVATSGFRDKGSWHGKEMEEHAGGIFTGHTTIYEQMVAASMDYKYVLCQASYDLPDGTSFPDNKRFAIMRPPVAWEDKWARMRVVGNRYNPLQHERMAQILEPLQNDWPLEGLGVLKNGKITFVELAVDQFNVGGVANELHKTYLLVADDKTQNSVVWSFVTVRVVCWNTFSFALSTAKEITSIPHSTNVDQELEFRANLVEVTLKARKEQEETLNQLFVTPITEEQKESVVTATFPDPKLSRAMKLAQHVPDSEVENEKFAGMLERAETDWQKQMSQIERTQKLRTEALNQMEKFNVEFPYAADTAYMALQGTTNVTNHSPLYTGSVEKGMVSLFFGQKAQANDRAWNAVKELVE